MVASHGEAGCSVSGSWGGGEFEGWDSSKDLGGALISNCSATCCKANLLIYHLFGDIAQCFAGVTWLCPHVLWSFPNLSVSNCRCCQPDAMGQFVHSVGVVVVAGLSLQVGFTGFSLFLIVQCNSYHLFGETKDTYYANLGLLCSICRTFCKERGAKPDKRVSMVTGAHPKGVPSRKRNTHLWILFVRISLCQ